MCSATQHPVIHLMRKLSTGDVHYFISILSYPSIVITNLVEAMIISYFYTPLHFDFVSKFVTLQISTIEALLFQGLIVLYFCIICYSLASTRLLRHNLFCFRDATVIETRVFTIFNKATVIEAYIYAALQNSFIPSFVTAAVDLKKSVHSTMGSNNREFHDYKMSNARPCQNPYFLPRIL